MLQATNNYFSDILERSNGVAFCPRTDALLTESRGQYTLIVPIGNTVEYRHYSKRKVHSLEEAITKAQKALDRIVKQMEAV